MFKEYIVGTPLACLAIRLRGFIELLECAIRRSESIGTVMNDQLADELASSLCSPDKVFLDVGAHIGSMIACAKRNSKPMKIIAIEAMPDKAKKLSVKFPDVEVLNYAASDKRGKADFFINDKASGNSSLHEVSSTTRHISVETELLDNLISTYDVDVIKIDIEGAELGALKGAVNLIERCQPIIMFESGPAEVLGYTKQQLWEFFSKLDYQICVPNRIAHHSPGLTLEMFLDSHIYPRRTTNYFAIPVSRVDEVRKKAAKN